MADRYLKCYGFVVAALLSLSCSEAPSDKLHSDTSVLSDHLDSPTSVPAVDTPLTTLRPASTPVSKVQTAARISTKPDKAVNRNNAHSNADVYLSSTMNVRPNGQDQSAQLNQVLGSLPPGATFVFDTGPEFLLGSPLLLTKP